MPANSRWDLIRRLRVNQAPPHDDIWGDVGIAPHFLKVCTRWRCVIILKPRPL